MTEPYYSDDHVTLHHGDCRDVLATLPDASVDAVVTDPPYELAFMGKGWDSSGIAFDVAMWAEVLRVLKPGGHLLAFGGTRTFHRVTVAIEDAGFEIRDDLGWSHMKHVFCQCGPVQYDHENVSRQGVHDLREGVDPGGQVPGSTEHDVRTGVRSEGERASASGQTEPEAPQPGGLGLHGVRGDLRAASEPRESGAGADMQQAVQRGEQGEGSAALRLQGRAGSVATGVGGVLPTEDDRPEQPSMEGRRDVLAEGGQLPGDQVRPSAGMGATDGPQGRVHHGASACDGDDGGASTDPSRGGAPCGPRSDEQRPGQPGAVPVEWIAQGGGAWPACPRCHEPLAPPFAAGPLAWNYGSGFPKSLDVSKAIDKARDDGREIRQVTAWIAATRNVRQVVNREIDAAFGFHGMAGHWTTQGAQAAVPTLDQVPRLLDVLGVDPDDVPDEIRRLLLDLNGRKGQPGENWLKREVVGIDRRMNEPSGIVGVGQGERVAIDRKITAPATPDAERWNGWGTALKPAWEPIIVARKPLSSPGVNVLEVVESGLRERGIEGVIQWTNGPASGAARSDRPTSSSSTAARLVAATSADPADASETPRGGRPTGSDSATSTPHGDKPTASTSAPTPAVGRPSFGSKSSPPTATPAPAAASESPTSSPSTTSTEAGPHTERRRGGRSTPRSSDSDSLTATGSFAGIATGLTGSWATVHIDRMADGTCVWPDGLPRFTAGRSTVAANVLEHGTGALNVDACRIGMGDEYDPTKVQRQSAASAGMAGIGQSGFASDHAQPTYNAAGRWPANVVLDEEAAALLDAQSGTLTSGKMAAGTCPKGDRLTYGQDAASGYATTRDTPGDTGGASRFFYVAKAPTHERPKVDGKAHATVKPLTLIRWLVRLVTPPGGHVLDPFAGSGTTAEACIVEGFTCTLIEKDADHLPLITERLAKPIQPTMFGAS